MKITQKIWAGLLVSRKKKEMPRPIKSAPIKNDKVHSRVLLPNSNHKVKPKWG
jgi:hypothetical protein